MVDVANIAVLQDGADFYYANGGGHLWSAPFCVPDFDLDTAMIARLDFRKWCADNGIRPSFPTHFGGSE